MHRSWQASVVLFAVLLFCETRTIESNSIGFAPSSTPALQDLFQGKYICNTRQARTRVVAAVPGSQQSLGGLPAPRKNTLRKKSTDVHPVVRIRELRSPAVVSATKLCTDSLVSRNHGGSRQASQRPHARVRRKRCNSEAGKLSQAPYPNFRLLILWVCNDFFLCWA
jgi:hypothetical protein